MSSEEQQQNPSAPETPEGASNASQPAASTEAPDQATAPVAEGSAPAATEEVPATQIADVVAVARERYAIDATVPEAVVMEWLEQTADNKAFTLSEWTNDLLLAVLLGKIKYPESELAPLADVYRQRFGLPNAWNEKGILAFVRTGEEPKKTSNGMWTVDITRPLRVPAEWLTAELEAWAMGEIQAGGRSHDNGLALEIKERLRLNAVDDTPKAVRRAFREMRTKGNIPVVDTAASQPVVVQASSEETQQLQIARAQTAQIESVKGLSTLNVAIINDGVQNYIDAVKPGYPVSEEKAIKAQRALDTMFQHVIGLEPEEMVAGLECLKKHFKRQMVKGGVFDHDNIFRFTHLLPTNNNLQARHKNTLELFRIYFSENREARRQTDPSILLSYQTHEKSVLLQEYFTRIA